MEMIKDCEVNEKINSEHKAAWFKLAGYLSFYNNDEGRPMFYLACGTCKKKVLDEPEGYRCENC